MHIQLYIKVKMHRNAVSTKSVYTSKTLLQLVKSEIIMLIESESIPPKSIETRNFANELNEVVELIK